MNEIEKCPFCGGRIIAKTRYIDYGSLGLGRHDEYRVVCQECRASSNEYRHEAEAIAAWNRRADHLPDTTKMVSNADRIRSMSDEELAEYIFDLGNGSEYCYGHCAYQDDCWPRGLDHDTCIKGVIDWLKQP